MKLQPLVLFISLFCATLAHAQEWQPVRGGITNNISGMALVSQNAGSSRFLIVMDNKGASEARAALVESAPNADPRFTSLTWTNSEANASLPIDLEAVCAIPQKSNEFLALTSSGAGFHVALDETKKTVRVLKSFTLPNVSAEANIESFDVKQIGGALIAFWAERGNNEQVAKLYWGRILLTDLTFRDVQTAEVSAPYPSSPDWTGVIKGIGKRFYSKRHASDLRVDTSGVLYLSSASDAGDDGPFSSAIYISGTFFRVGNAVQFEQNLAPVVLRKFKYHKVEALEMLPGDGGLVVGTDDENLGSSLCFLAGE